MSSSELVQGSLSVRIASESDAMMLARLRYELRSSGRDVVENELTFLERCACWMQRRLELESSWKCWIAEWDQEPVGSVWVQLIEKIPNPITEGESYVYLTSFYVREQYRSKGIGAMLLSAAVAWSKSQKAHAVILWPTERSKPFYSRHGFVVADDVMQLSLSSKSSLSDRQ
jgi:GNAT superfamily N-acetyltransferase